MPPVKIPEVHVDRMHLVENWMDGTRIDHGVWERTWVQIGKSFLLIGAVPVTVQEKKKCALTVV